MHQRVGAFLRSRPARPRRAAALLHLVVELLRDIGRRRLIVERRRSPSCGYAAGARRRRSCTGSPSAQQDEKASDQTAKSTHQTPGTSSVRVIDELQRPARRLVPIAHVEILIARPILLPGRRQRVRRGRACRRWKREAPRRPAAQCRRATSCLRLRMTVSGRFGNATRPKRRPEQGRRRNESSDLMSPPGVRSESPIRTAAPLPKPPARKKSRRALSGEAMRAAPSPRPAISRSSSSQLKTIVAMPGGMTAVRGSRDAGNGSPTSGERRRSMHAEY